MSTVLVFPGVYVRELDFSDYAQVVGRTILGIVGVALKGPLHKPTLITNEDELVKTFGPPPDVEGGVNERQRIKLTAGATGTFKMAYNGVAASATIAVSADAATMTTHLNSIAALNGNVAVTGGSGNPWVVTFIGTLAERNVLPLTVDTQPSTGTASVEVIEQGSTAPSDYGMLAAMMFLREGNQLYFVRTCEIDANGNWLASVASTPASTATGAMVWDDIGTKRAIQAFALSAGEWGNELQLRFTKTSGSKNEKQTLVFPAGINGQNYTLTAPAAGAAGANITTANISYNTDPATHAAAIQAALNTAANTSYGTTDVTYFTVTVTGSGASAVFTVEFTGPNVRCKNQSQITFGAGTYVGPPVINTTQGGVTVENDVYKFEVLGPVDNSGSTIGVLETFERVMLVNDEASLANNNAYWLKEIVNDGVRNVQAKSAYIKFTEDGSNNVFPTSWEDIALPLVPGDVGGTNTYTFSGGYAAIDANRAANTDLLRSAYIGTEADAGNTTLGIDPGPTALQLLENPENLDVNLICVPGVTDAGILTELITICEARKDAMALMDTPKGLKHSDAVDWHNKEGSYSSTGFKPNSSYAALYWPWVKVFDTYNRKTVTVPPTVVVPGAFALNDFLAAAWFAPAGETRGRMKYALELESKTPPRGALENMYSGGNVLNPIIDFVQRGIMIYGQRTTQRRASALDRINVRRMLMLVQKVIAGACRILVMEPNDETTWNRLISLVTPVLEQVKRGRGLIDYKVICDRSTNPPDQIDANKMRAVLFIKPTKAAEIIQLDFAVVSTGAEFDIKLVTP